MLNLVLKNGDRIQIGDNVVIKLQSDSRAQLAIPFVFIQTLKSGISPA